MFIMTDIESSARRRAQFFLYTDIPVRYISQSHCPVCFSNRRFVEMKNISLRARRDGPAARVTAWIRILHH